MLAVLCCAVICCAAQVEMVSGLDVSKTDGIIVCGGDGLVHEVITGYVHAGRHLPVVRCPLPLALFSCSEKDGQV